eukprot:SAG31_NODE_919_length_11010_cov_27.449821_7_plen_61_part_00
MLKGAHERTKQRRGQPSIHQAFAFADGCQLPLQLLVFGFEQLAAQSCRAVDLALLPRHLR